VQKVLSSALLYEQNPGVRLRAANAFRAYETQLPDPEVKSSLITVLLSDENPAVRKEALSVLQKFSFDAEIKRAFLSVLSRDKNPGLRVAAIKSLETSGALDAETYDVLRDRLKADDNDYIKERARFVLTAARQL
jgi:HEAT repeat protein